MDRRGAAYDLLLQYMRTNKINLILGQEPNIYAKKNNICDIDCDSFIRTNLGDKFNIVDYVSGTGFVCVEYTNMLVFSCYFSPSKPSDLLNDLLYEINAVIR